MTRKKRIRRAALICCHCTRNIAYYRAGRKDNYLINETEYGATVNSNFIDSGLLEWCKVFGNHEEKHHWKNIISNKTSFRDNMIETINIDLKELKAYWKKVLTYRNKFLAHLDSNEIMDVPKLDVTLKTVFFYYSYLYKHQNTNGVFNGLPNTLEEYYEKCYKEASA